MSKNPDEPPEVVDDRDRQELATFKKAVHGGNVHLVSDEASYLKEFRKHAVHMMDPRTGRTIVSTFYFNSEEAAQAALEHAKALKGTN